MAFAGSQTGTLRKTTSKVTRNTSITRTLCLKSCATSVTHSPGWRSALSPSTGKTSSATSTIAFLLPLRRKKASASQALSRTLWSSFPSSGNCTSSLSSVSLGGAFSPLSPLSTGFSTWSGWVSLAGGACPALDSSSGFSTSLYSPSIFSPGYNVSVWRRTASSSTAGC